MKKRARLLNFFGGDFEKYESLWVKVNLKGKCGRKVCVDGEWNKTEIIFALLKPK